MTSVPVGANVKSANGTLSHSSGRCVDQTGYSATPLCPVDMRNSLTMVFVSSSYSARYFSEAWSATVLHFNAAPKISTSTNFVVEDEASPGVVKCMSALSRGGMGAMGAGAGGADP